MDALHTVKLWNASGSGKRDDLGHVWRHQQVRHTDLGRQPAVEFLHIPPAAPAIAPLQIFRAVLRDFTQGEDPMSLAATETRIEYLRALPGDDVRQILWRFADRFDLQMLVQSVRAVARGPVARLVAAGRPQHPRVDRRQSRRSSRPSTNPASPASSWTPTRAASSKGPRTWRSR